ncbi:MAG: PASTA domain-containing protein [Solobacterium sp.]|nr:PASTA domain-containing protein [Solobacterium sp.]
MKRFLTRLLCVFLLVMPFAGCAAEKPDSQKKDCALYLDISFDSNLFLDRYDIEVYVDETKVGDIKHGDPFSVLLTVKEGKHTVYFYKPDDHNVSGSEKITLEGDMTFKCTIKPHGSYVETRDVEKIDSIEGSAIPVPDLTGQRFGKARETLENLGFRNIDYETTDDSSVWDSSNWIVTKQSAAAGSEADKNTQIVLTVIRLSDHLARNFSGRPVSDALKRAEKLGYQVVYIEDLAGTDYSNVFKDMPEEKAVLYTVDHAELKETSAGDTLHLYTDYEREASFSKESAKRAAVTALTNYFASDVYDSDGNVDPSKFHTYADTSGNTDDYYLRVLDGGTWTVINDNRIHCDGLRLKNSWDTIFLFDLDVTYDGTVYTIAKVIDAKGTNASNTQVYPDTDVSYTVTPDMIEQGRSGEAASSGSIPTDGNINSFLKYMRDTITTGSPEIELNEDIVYVRLYYDGLAALADAAKENGGEKLASWNSVTSTVRDLCIAIMRDMRTANVTGYHTAVILMNDLDTDSLLYAVVDGETIADYPND